MTMPNKQLLGVKFKDKQLPMGLRAAIASRYKAGYGAAFVDNDPKTSEAEKLRILHSDDPVTVEEITSWMDALKDVNVLMTFTDAEQPLIQADYQPFVALRSDKDYPICVAAIHGDFTVCEDPQAARTPASLSFEDHIQPILAKLYTDCGNDLKKFFEAVGTDEARKKIFAQTKEGWILFLGINGETKSIIKGNLEKGKLLDPKWGFLSVDPDAEAVPDTAKPAPGPVRAPDKPVEPEHKPRSFGGVKKPVSQEGNKKEDKPDKEPIKIDNPQPDTAIPAKEVVDQLQMGYSLDNGELFYQCPEGPGYENWQQVRSAYERHYGAVPNPYKSRPKLKVTDPKILATFQDLLDTATKIVKPSDDKTPKDFPAAKEAVARHITADEKKKLSALIIGDDEALSSIDKKDELVPEQELETELPTFAEASGAGDNVLITQRFRPEFLAKIQKECPAAFLQLLLDWRKYGMMMAHRVKQLETRIAKDEEDTKTTPEHKARSFGGVKKTA